MKTCVLIDVDDRGQVSVGTYPGPLPQGVALKPAASVDEALAQAKQLLGEEQGEAAPDQEQGEQTPAQAEGSFKQGFQRAQPAGPTRY